MPWPSTLDVGSYRVSRWLRQNLVWAFPFRFARELARRRVDLVHTHVTHRIDLQAEGAIRRARLPMVWTIHGQYRPEGRELERWRRATRLMTGAGAITAVAEDLARDFRQRGLAHPDGIEVTRGGVDLSAFRSSPARDPRRREEWKIPAEAIVFGASGRLVSEKAYEVFVRAAGRIVREGADAHFVIAGGGPLKRELLGEIARAGLEGPVSPRGVSRECARVPPGTRRVRALFPLRGFSDRARRGARGEASVHRDAGGGRSGDGRRAMARSWCRPSPRRRSRTRCGRCCPPEVRASFAARGPRIAERFSIDRMAEQFASIYERLLSVGAPGAKTQRKVNER